jgi:hypothetical protein
MERSVAVFEEIIDFSTLRKIHIHKFRTHVFLKGDKYKEIKTVTLL